MVNLSDFVGFALTVTTRVGENKGGKLIFDRSSAKPIFTQSFKHQINSKLDVSERFRYNPSIYYAQHENRDLRKIKDGLNLLVKFINYS